MPFLRVALTVAVGACLVFGLLAFGHLMPWHRSLPSQESGLQAQQDGKPASPEAPAKAAVASHPGGGGAVAAIEDGIGNAIGKIPTGGDADKASCLPDSCKGHGHHKHHRDD